MPVVVVESPAKAKTINKYLATTTLFWRLTGMCAIFHQRTDQSDPDARFRHALGGRKSDSKKHVKAIADALKDDNALILATDPDREGEAISWHLQEALTKRKSIKKDTAVSRVTFNAITKDAVSEAMAEPAPGRYAAGRSLSRPPRARLSGRLQPLARSCGANCPAQNRPAGSNRSAFA